MIRARYTVDENGCWLWDGGLDRDGYGQCSVNNKTRHVYRYHYELVNGPVPVGKQLDHVCKVKRCVNPDHVKPVTVAENSQRRSSTKLSPEKVRLIRDRYASGNVLQKELAAEFGIGKPLVSMVINKHTWKNV